MKLSRWASLLLVACVGLSGQRADAMRTPLTDVRASITQPHQLTAVTAASDLPADVPNQVRDASTWIVESIIPLGTTADGQPLALISLLIPNSSLDELTPASTRAGPYAAPKTHTRVFCIVQPPLGLVAKQEWDAKRQELIARGGWWNVVAFGSSLGEAVLDVASLGAFGANDRLADREIAGEITAGQYWSGVAVNTSVRAAAVVTAGAAAPAAAGAVGGGLIVQGAAGGAAAGLAYSTVEVVGTRAGYEMISDIDYEQSVVGDLKQVAISTGAGLVGGTLFGAAAAGDAAIAARNSGMLNVVDDLAVMQRRLERLGYDEANTTRILRSIQNQEQVVVVGENMDRVNAVANMVNRAGGKAVTYSPRNWTGVHRNSLEANRSWIRYWMRDKGIPAIDIGRQATPRLTGPSPFYGIENRSLNRWGIYTPFTE